MTRATAIAHANIALVKYWGKRDAGLNLPAAGSLSLTLGALSTTTTVELKSDLSADELVLDGKPASADAVSRLSVWLDLVRAEAGIDDHARVVSSNDFPTASGLASSASAYAALAVAATVAAGLDLSPTQLSILARRGSGSAARSIFGGLVRMFGGTAADGSDCFAKPIDSATDWPLRMVIAIVGGGVVKAISSRDAMDHCSRTSPLYRGWIDSVDGDLKAAEAAIAARDLEALGAVVEASALTMHASALASRPAIRYFAPATIACLDAVLALRADGAVAYYTMDAGPHVKVLTNTEHVEAVSNALRNVKGVSSTMVSAPGGPAHIVDDPE